MRDDRPIYKSRIDTDFYKFTMGQLIQKLHPNVPVEFSFFNRTKSVRLAEVIDMDELRENLEEVRRVPTKSDDLRCLMGTAYDYGRSMFDFDFIKFFEGLKLPEFQLGSKDGQLDLRFFGDWSAVTYWEVPAMYIVKELYRRTRFKEMSLMRQSEVEKEGRERLNRKIDFLSRHPEVTFSDFGTRRRRSFDWQDFVVGKIAERFKNDQFRGTSNLLLAKKYGIRPMSTYGHEPSMIYSGIFWNEDEKDPAYSQRQFLLDWEDMYGLELSIFLPDTFGTDWFFDNVVTPEQLKNWKGSRNDSEDPIRYSKNMIGRYQKYDIDPMSKFIVDADSQNPQIMVNTASEFKNSMPHTFGWGTDLTDDLGLYQISIVVKPTMARGKPLCKLSDNLKKATGSPEAIERAKRLRHYAAIRSVKCVS